MSKFSQHNFKNEKALVRVDFNVPLDEQLSYYGRYQDARCGSYNKKNY